MNREAFWLRGARRYDVAETHIRFVLDHADLFGVSREEIDELFERHQETPGFEGKARQDLFIALFRKGWIRVRHKADRTGDWFVFEFSGITDAALPITRFILEMSRGPIPFINESPIQLNGLDDGFRRYYSFSEGGATAFVKDWTQGDTGKTGKAASRKLEERGSI
jgi:hypothetical protein